MTMRFIGSQRIHIDVTSLFTPNTKSVDVASPAADFCPSHHHVKRFESMVEPHYPSTTCPTVHGGAFNGQRPSSINPSLSPVSHESKI